MTVVLKLVSFHPETRCFVALHCVGTGCACHLLVVVERLKTRHCEGNCHVYSVVHTVVNTQQTYEPQAETIPNYVIPVPHHYVYRTTSTILVVLLVLLDCTLVLLVSVLLVLITSPAASILHLFRGNIVPAGC